MLNILLKTLETQKMNDSFSLNETVKIILDTYNELYNKVPNISFKNKIIDVINVKKEICEIKINDNKEELESKISLKAGYEIEKRDSYFVVDQLNGLIDSLDSEVVKKDLEKFLFKFVSERKEKSENKEELILSSIKKLEMQIEFLDREVEHLDYLLSIIDFRNLDIELVLEDKKFFNFSDLLKYKINNKSSEEQLIELVSGKNLILFADCVDLSEIPNDKNFLEKINKFLGDTEFSIQSQKFMEVNSLNNEFVKKLNAPREEIWSRRESRTPVRVYFIPIHCKYFTCHYVVNVTYKDHAHLDGGCSSDDVYKRRLKEAKVLERYINELEVEDLIEFVIQSKERYDTIIEPIVSKVELYNKRKGKK